MAKKGKKMKKKVKKVSVLSPEDQKKQLITTMMAKCDMTEEEVLEAHDKFHKQHEQGVILKKEFVHSRKVIKNQTSYFWHYFVCFSS